MLLCCVVLRPEAAIAKLSQSSTETGTQAGLVEVRVNRSPLACKEENIWHCSNNVREGETFLLSGSLDKVTKLECMNKLA